MKHLSVKIPDSLYQSFMDFFKHIPNVVITEQLDEEIPTWQQKIVLDRIKKEKTTNAILWSEARKKLKFKSK
ncbi:MAG: hypothetical protein COX70_00300 [Flavobacteriales bacterium CG_4_10_14_0_2_um_filter_32_8]|nr:MAG: hypothetical protein COX70_00300 [Flavobacteriales bacterium CG_4_10_14_0_2_um_filter_32_8]PJB14638.1 MAG: hypothetical protein CO118_07505 [Flavobacteriales bacterium CG_4_9_14_3_um_filter_32_8]